MGFDDIAGQIADLYRSQLAVEKVIAEYCPSLIETLQQFKNTASVAHDANVGQNLLYSIINLKKSATIETFNKLYSLYNRYLKQEKREQELFQRYKNDLDIIGQYVVSEAIIFDANGSPYGNFVYRLPRFRCAGIELYDDDYGYLIQVHYRPPQDVYLNPVDGDGLYYVYDEGSPSSTEDKAYDSIKSFLADYILMGKLSPRLS